MNHQIMETNQQIFDVLRIQKCEILDFEKLLNALVVLGYRWKDCVEQPGDFSHRGYIIDIFPQDRLYPIRLELFDNSIERIVSFDQKKGNTVEELSVVVITPIKIKSFKSPQLKVFQESEDVDRFTDFQEEDYVVHIGHGIGKYLGRKKLRCSDTGALKDYLILEYKDKDRLYVPVEEISQVRRYIGIDRKHPPLNKLGTKFWEAAKQRADKSIQSLAVELINLQALRSSKKGFAFSTNTQWQDEFNSKFPFTETPDQLRSWLEVKEDMEKEVPMDRLICGDVGYGKTEVCIRAAFKCVMDHKQVALLVPTTLLAEQHYWTFKERFKDFPVEIRMLSRFVSPQEQKATVLAASEGKVDVLIGTHRLLSSDVGFKNLGLVIIDEEQRFGVRHKERFKRLRLLVDVLTLTATPIPRTLYMSLTGVRDMSIINTAPLSRMPVKTIVCGFEDSTIREAVQREIERKGQMFFVHNRVETIEPFSNKIRTILSGLNVRIAIAHGQMQESVLEGVMRDFIQKKIDILVSTSIIESGLDIPNANTICIDRSDMFGLSDLYQLRGRVGRSDVQGYCYLFVWDRKILTADAEKRLACMERFTELGSGFRIAMEDLQIRGSGNLLGVEQSGYICSIGFDLYCRLLRDAVKNIQRRIIKNEDETCFLNRNNLARKPGSFMST